MLELATEQVIAARKQWRTSFEGIAEGLFPMAPIKGMFSQKSQFGKTLQPEQMNEVLAYLAQAYNSQVPARCQVVLTATTGQPDPARDGRVKVILASPVGNSKSKHANVPKPQRIPAPGLDATFAQELATILRAARDKLTKPQHDDFINLLSMVLPSATTVPGGVLKQLRGKLSTLLDSDQQSADKSQKKPSRTTAFHMFMALKHRDYGEPGAPIHTKSEQLSDAWNRLTDDEKNHYQELAKKKYGRCLGVFF